MDPGWGQEYTGRLLMGYHGVFWQHWSGWIMWLVLQCQCFKEVMFMCLWLLWWSGLLWGCSRWPPPLSSWSVSCLFVVVVQKKHWTYPKSYGVERDKDVQLSLGIIRWLPWSQAVWMGLSFTAGRRRRIFFFNFWDCQQQTCRATSQFLGIHGMVEWVDVLFGEL